MVVTNVLASASTACQKQMIQGSAPSGSYEAPQSFVPWEYNSVLGSLVGMLAVALSVGAKMDACRGCASVSGPLRPVRVSRTFCSRWTALSGRVATTPLTCVTK